MQTPRHERSLFSRLDGVAAIAAALVVASSPAQTACDADLDGSGVVGPADLAQMLAAWGACTSCSADIDGNGDVDAADLGSMLSVWGDVCNPLPWATVLAFDPDPAIVVDDGLRKAILATGLPWRVRDNASHIEMLVVPAGTFAMGCSASNAHPCSSNEIPVHTVTLTSPFYLGRFEVTQAEWTARMGTNPSSFQGPSYPDAANRPVEGVGWAAVQGFLSASGLRLPTEAEWEFACRAGTSTAFHSTPSSPIGTNVDAQTLEIAWFASNNGPIGSPSYGTKVVGLKAPNGLGFHDMSGNVYEWVNDWYGANYYASSPAVDPPGPASGPFRVSRGGSWLTNTSLLRSSNRTYTCGSGSLCDDRGFRAARNP